MKFSFTVPGSPRPKERPRVRKDGRTFTPEQTAIYEGHVKACCLAALGLRRWPLDGDCRVDVVVYVSGGARADLDNCAKSLLDAMQGVAYKNDRQVSYLSIMRLQGEPRAEVTVTMLSRPTAKAPSAGKRAVRGLKPGVHS